MNDSFWTALTINPFLVMALMAGFAASFAGGMMGSYVVVKRIVFLAGSIAHAVLGGIGLFVYLQYKTGLWWFNPLFGGGISSLFFGFVIGWIHLHYKEREDTIIAMIWSMGMAAGVIFMAYTPGNNAELINFLFGNILWSTSQDFWLLLILDVLIFIVILFCHKRFMAICFDETLARLQKQPVVFLYFLLLSLVSLTIILMIQTIGAILVVAMLSLPPAIANCFTQTLSKIMVLAIIFSIIFTVLGIYVSYHLNWPVGATIALITTIVYFFTLPVNRRSI